MNDNLELKIVSIAKIKDKTKFSVVVDNYGEILCYKDLIFKYKLLKDKTLKKEELQEILKEQRKYDIKRTALNFISYKPRTEYQVQQKLLKSGYNSQEIEYAIKFLKDFGYLDDKAYAISFSKDFLKRKPSGEIRLRQELKKRGIKKEIIEEVLENTFDNAKTYSLAIESARKKIKSISHKPPEKQKNSLIQFLQRQGFDWDIIKQVLSDIFISNI